MYEVASHDGRLVVARVGVCDTVEEARLVMKEVGAAFGKVPGLAIASADFRFAKLFPQEVSDIFIMILKSDNPKLERSAHLINNSAVFGLQAKRMMLSAQNPVRKMFYDTIKAEEYLGEVLTPSQRIWLHDWYTKKPFVL